MWLAVPTVVVVVLIILWSLPHLTLKYLEPSQMGFRKNWVAFVGVILALSGVEAIANLTGVMKLDSSSSLEAPQVLQTARKPICPVPVHLALPPPLPRRPSLSLPPRFE